MTRRARPNGKWPWVSYGRSSTIRSTAAIPSYSCRDRCGAEDARPVPGKDLPSALLANVRSAAQYRSGECHIECLCRLKVCTQLEVTWFAYWEIARLGSLQDLVDHGSAAAEQHRQVRSIAQQASSVGNFAETATQRESCTS